jgi:hypothetical protein
VLRFLAMTLVITSIYPAFAKRNKNFDELADYYYRVSDGLITPKEGRDESIDSFRCKKRARVCSPRDLSLDHDLLNNLFSFDVRNYVERSPYDNFLDAKVKFYESRPYSKWRGKRTHAYKYFSSWRSLYHPPIRELDSDFSLYGSIFKRPSEVNLDDSPMFTAEYHHELDRLTNTEMTRGNELRQLNNGRISIAEKIRMADEAKNISLRLLWFSIVMNTLSLM